MTRIDDHLSPPPLREGRRHTEGGRDPRRRTALRPATDGFVAGDAHEGAQLRKPLESRRAGGAQRVARVESVSLLARRAARAPEAPPLARAVELAARRNARLLEARGVTISLHDGADVASPEPRARLDVAARSTGLGEPGHRWRELTGSEVRRVVRDALQTNLATGAPATPGPAVERFTRALFGALRQQEVSFYSHLAERPGAGGEGSSVELLVGIVHPTFTLLASVTDARPSAHGGVSRVPQYGPGGARRRPGLFDYALPGRPADGGVTTLALGEEDGFATTLALGEEDGGGGR